MLHFLPGPIKGSLGAALVILNTILLFIPFICMTLIKVILRIPALQKQLSGVLISIASFWIYINTQIMKLTLNIEWKINITEPLDQNQWYLVSCNHQSWADICIMQSVLLNKTPFLKFFLKQELIWVPLLGAVWWACDYPFMKRYSKKQLQENPNLRGIDISTTQKACEKFKEMPTAIMNFFEGTRFTPAKHSAQNSPYKHLLKPKGGGAAIALKSMNGYINKILDMSIAYDATNISLWGFLSGKVKKIFIQIQLIPIAEKWLTGDYQNDPAFRKAFQEWINQIWYEKDQGLEQLKAQLHRE